MPQSRWGVVNVETYDRALSVGEILQHYSAPLPPSAVPYSLDEARESDLYATRLTIRWADGCAMTYRLTDEVRASQHGNLAREEAVRDMVERHEYFHAADQLHSPLCGTAHGVGTCPLCDVILAKERIAAMTGVQPHTLVVPEWMAEWERAYRLERKHGIVQELVRDTCREEAAAPVHPPVRRYCALEG